MTKEQQEILNKVKLFMNYDMKKTLTENYQVILNEQPAPGTILRPDLPGIEDINYPIQLAVWLNKNVKFSTDPIYIDNWKRYLLKLESPYSLEALLYISQKLAEKGYGPISPGLYGANKPNAGIANLPLENKIYVLRKRK